MDILKNKSYKQYDSVSRYTVFPYYYNTEDAKYIYGITAWLDSGANFVLHTIISGDTFDSLAFKYYGRPDFYWIIADYNRINDPYIILYEKYKTLKIPSLSNIKFMRLR